MPASRNDAAILSMLGSIHRIPVTG